MMIMDILTLLWPLKRKREGFYCPIAGTILKSIFPHVFEPEHGERSSSDLTLSSPDLY